MSTHTTTATRPHPRGLTLIELGAVVAVLAVILAIAIPFFLHQREDAYNKRAISSLRNSLSVARGAAANNEDIYPGTNDAELVTALTTIETSINHTTNGSQDYLTVSVHRRSDMSIVLAAYAAETETCWFLYNWHSPGEDLSELDDKTMIFNGEPMTAEEAAAGGCDADAYDPSAGGPGSGNQTPPGDDGDEDGGDPDDVIANPPCAYDPACFEATAWGDPHIVTFDGVGYEFQTKGDYVFTQTLPGLPGAYPDVNIHIRTDVTDGLAYDWVSVVTGVAMEIPTRDGAGRNIVSFELGDPQPRVNGTPVEIEVGEPYSLSGDPQDLTSAGYIYYTGHLWRAVWPGDDDLRKSRPGVDFRARSNHINVYAYATTDYVEHLDGVAGYPDDDPYNDLRVNGDDPLEIPASNHQIHTALASSWAVAGANSLFEQNGHDPATYDATFPTRYTAKDTPIHSFEGVDEEDIEEAHLFCELAEVHPNNMTSCMIDYLAAGGDPQRQDDAVDSAIEATVPTVVNLYDNWDQILTFSDGKKPHELPGEAAWPRGTHDQGAVETYTPSTVEGSKFIINDRSDHVDSHFYKKIGVVGDQFTFQADVRLGLANSVYGGADVDFSTLTFGMMLVDDENMYWVRFFPTHIRNGNLDLADRQKVFVTNMWDRYAQVRIVKDGGVVSLYVDGEHAFDLTPSADPDWQTNVAPTMTYNSIAFGLFKSPTAKSGKIYFDNVTYAAEARGNENMQLWAPNPWAKTTYFSNAETPRQSGWDDVQSASGVSTYIEGASENDEWYVDKHRDFNVWRYYQLPYTVPVDFTFQTEVRVTASSGQASNGAYLDQMGIRVADGQNEWWVRVFPTFVADGNTSLAEAQKFVTDLESRTAELRIVKQDDKAHLYVDGQYAFELTGTESDRNHVAWGVLNSSSLRSRAYFDDISIVGAALPGAEGMETWAPNPWSHGVDMDDGKSPLSHGWELRTTSTDSYVTSAVADGELYVEDQRHNSGNAGRYYTVPHVVTPQFTVQLDTMTADANSTVFGIKPYNTTYMGLTVADGTNRYAVRIQKDLLVDWNDGANTYSITNFGEYIRLRISLTEEGAALYVNGEKAFDLAPADAGGVNEVAFGLLTASPNGPTGRAYFDNVKLAPAALGAANMESPSS